MINFDDFTFNSDGTISGLADRFDFDAEIARISTPTQRPFGLFGQELANSINRSAQSLTPSVTSFMTTSTRSNLLLGVGVLIAAGAGFMLIKGKVKK